MKILIISLWSVSENSIGGTEKFIVDLSSLLAKKCSVTVLSIGSVKLKVKKVDTFSLNLVSELDEYSLIKYLENSGLADISLKLNTFIRKKKFDVVHCNSLLFANLIKDVPVIHTVHTNKEEFNGLFPANISSVILENIKNDKKTIYVVPSLYAKKSFRSLVRKTSLIITHAYRPDISLQKRAFFRQKYKISKEEIVFCVPSRLEIKQKGQAILLEALQRNKQILPPFVVVLGGCDGQYLRNKKYLLKRYSDLKLIIDSFPDKNEMYSLADLVVLPSKTESFGYAALESSMLGFSVFLSDIPPHREIAMGNQRIILFKNNEIELAKTMVHNYKMILNHKIIPPPKKWRDRYLESNMVKKYLFLYAKQIINFKQNQ